MKHALPVAYYGLLTLLALFGLHRYVLLAMFARVRRRVTRSPAAPLPLPSVTVQLPVYNERYVVDRLMAAVSRLDYPRHLLEIQLLDDSTDDTIAVGAEAVARARAAGFDAVHVRRPARDGFKAGALRNGLETAKGELIAIFDADFVPDPDFLKNVVSWFGDSEVGMVQARWGHLNGAYSALTEVQSVFLDGHFLIEQRARADSGLFFNFNGTAGVWRRSCIEDAGGWQEDTLTEDLDLSYRAQLRGWRFVYLPGLVAKAELPVSMPAFKSQQYRWTKGSVETCLKILPRLLSSPVALRVKIEAICHLASNFAYVALFLLSLLMFPALMVKVRRGAALGSLDLSLLLFGVVAVYSYYLTSQRVAGRSLGRSILLLPMLSAVGMGMSLSNTRAVFSALFGRRTDFHRTPKYDILRRGDRWRDKSYRSPAALLPFFEVGLAAYFVFAIVLALKAGLFYSLPFFALFAAGFGYVGVMSLRGARG